MALAELVSWSYLPLAHILHSDAPVLSATTSVILLVTQPFGQSIHVLAASAPVAVENLPATQSMQSEAASLPVSVKYVPAIQDLHSV